MQTAPFRILRFFTKYTTRDGQPHAVDMVEICAPGMAQRTTTPLRIADVVRVRDDGDPDNPGWLMAKMRRDIIMPAYEAWKRNEAAPETGTALAAWSGLTAEQADAFRVVGLRSVEEIASATESVINRAQLPNVRSIQQQARLFLENMGSSKVAAALEQKDREMAAMREEMEEMKKLLLDQMNDEEAPRRRGRPPKVADEVAA